MTEPIIKHFSGFVKGLNFRGDPIVDFCTNDLVPGEDLLAIRDPYNEHDENAIEIYSSASSLIDQCMLGFLQKEVAAITAPYMDKGWDCEVIAEDKASTSYSGPTASGKKSKAFWLPVSIKLTEPIEPTE